MPFLKQKMSHIKKYYLMALSAVLVSYNALKEDNLLNFYKANKKIL